MPGHGIGPGPGRLVAAGVSRLQRRRCRCGPSLITASLALFGSSRRAQEKLSNGCLGALHCQHRCGPRQLPRPQAFQIPAPTAAPCTAGNLCVAPQPASANVAELQESFPAGLSKLRSDSPALPGHAKTGWRPMVGLKGREGSLRIIYSPYRNFGCSFAGHTSLHKIATLVSISIYI